MEHQQGVVPFGEGMAQIGARARSVVAVMHLAVAEMKHQIFIVHDTDVQKMRGACRQGDHQTQSQENGSFHKDTFNWLSVTNVVYFLINEMIPLVKTEESGPTGRLLDKDSAGQTGGR